LKSDESFRMTLYTYMYTCIRIVHIHTYGTYRWDYGYMYLFRRAVKRKTLIWRRENDVTINRSGTRERDDPAQREYNGQSKKGKVKQNTNEDSAAK